MCNYCDDAKDYIKTRKTELTKAMGHLRETDDMNPYFVLEHRLRELEAVEAVIYGGLMYVPEGDK